MLSLETIQSVRDLNIFDVLNRYVQLKKEGSIYKACCPIHQEKSPSFTVNPAKGMFKCFGCGEGGDAIAFVMKHDKLQFTAAVEKIARDNNIHIEHEQVTEEQKEREEAKKTLFDATRFANQYYKQSLENNAEANDYILQRGITAEEVKKWSIGYASGESFIKTHAVDSGHVELYASAGLLGKNETNGTTYDFFRNRITIPIIDHNGNVLSFSARTMGEDTPKYINGRETDIYSKQNILFGIHQYQQVDKKQPFSVLVEGNFDVISLHQVGVTNALAASGTALSSTQCKTLKKLADTVILFPDNDKAGIKSALKNIDLLLEHNLKAKIYINTVGKDADDFCKEFRKGETETFDIMAVAVDAVEWKCGYLLTDKTTPDEIAESKNNVGQLLSKIKNETLRSEYVKFVAKKFKLKEKELAGIIKTIEDAELKKAKEKVSKEAVVDVDYPEWFDLEKRKHLNKFQFAEYIHAEETGYYFPDDKWYPKRMTNFVMIPLYMIKSYQNPRRMVEVYGWNNLNNKMISEVIDFDEKQIAKKDGFETRLIEQSPFITLEGFNASHHKRLISKLLFQFKDCFELRTLGYQPEQFWAFSDVCFEFPNKENLQGIRREYNEFGVVEIGELNYLSEAKNKRLEQQRADNNNPYENDLYFVYRQSPVSFKEWAALVNQVYLQDKSWLATAYVIVTIYKDLITNHTKIPHLHCYGEKGSGKSEYAESIFNLFFSGKDSENHLYKPYNLAGGGTPYSFHNRLERFRNCPQILNEYDDTNILPEFFDAIKATFDGEGRERGMGIKGKTETMKRNSTLILVGQKIGNRDDNSVLTRSITIQFLKPDSYTAEAEKLLSELKRHEHAGLSSLIIEILSHRIYFKEKFAERFLKTVTTLQRRVAGVFQKTETRIIKSLSALQLCYQIIGEITPLPLSATEVEQMVFNKAIEMHEHLQSTDGLSEFWKVIEFLLDRNEIENDWDFKIRAATNVKIRKTIDGKNVDDTVFFSGEKKLLYIRLSQLHQYYALHVNRTSKSEKPLTEKTIVTYMSSQPYWIGLCPGTRFNSKNKNKTKDSTSCYVIDYEKLGVHLETTSYSDDRIEETVEGVIYRLNEESNGYIKFCVKATIMVKSEPTDHVQDQYTNCFIGSEKSEVALLSQGKKIRVKGLMTVDIKGYRNMDVLAVSEVEANAGVF